MDRLFHSTLLLHGTCPSMLMHILICPMYPNHISSKPNHRT
jgi:hypothetical protein